MSAAQNASHPAAARLQIQCHQQRRGRRDGFIQRAPLRMLRIGDDRAAASMIDLSRQHAGPLLHVQRHSDTASSDDAEIARNVLRRIAYQQSHACARLEAAITQLALHAADRTTQLRISPHTAMPRQSRRVRHLPGDPVEVMYQGCAHAAACATLSQAA